MNKELRLQLRKLTENIFPLKDVTIYDSEFPAKIENELRWQWANYVEFGWECLYIHFDFYEHTEKGWRYRFEIYVHRHNIELGYRINIKINDADQQDVFVRIVEMGC